MEYIFAIITSIGVFIYYHLDVLKKEKEVQRIAKYLKDMTTEEMTLDLIKDVKRDVRGLYIEIGKIKIEMAVLKTRAAVWGSLAGSVPVVIGFVIKTIWG